MTWTKVVCKREGCPGLFTVDNSVEERRCPKCGLKHYGPWDDPQADTEASSGGFVSEDRPAKQSQQSGLQRRERDSELSDGRGGRTCRRCGTEYDPDRETPKPWMDSARCPSCGCKNEPGQTPATTQPVARTDGGLPTEVSSVVESLTNAGKEVHLHVHYHQG